MILPNDRLRECLTGAEPIANTHLALFKLGPPMTRGDHGHEQLIEALSRQELSESWRGFFRRWQRATPPSSAERAVFQVTTASPLLSGTGEAAPGENGLSLHHTYGAPIIPGSSLKGICRAWCEQQYAGLTAGDGPHDWAPGGASFEALFGAGGSDGAAGVVDFLDALVVPGGPPPFQKDVLTPHQQAYYQGKAPPNGFDGPVPVFFLSVEGTFRIVLEGPPAWVAVARQLLMEALEKHGVGAKTRAGYGRLVGSTSELDAIDGAVFVAREAAARRALPAPSRVKLAVEAAAANPQALEEAVRAVLLGEAPEHPVLDPNSDHRLFDLGAPAERPALAALAKALGLDKRWRRQLTKSSDAAKKETANQLLTTLEAWGVSAPAGADASSEVAEVQAKPTSKFGVKTLPDNRAKPKASQLKNPKKRKKAAAQLQALVLKGGYTEAEVQRALQLFADWGADPSVAARVRSYYGIEPG